MPAPLSEVGSDFSESAAVETKQDHWRAGSWLAVGQPHPSLELSADGFEGDRRAAGGHQSAVAVVVWKPCSLSWEAEAAASALAAVLLEQPGCKHSWQARLVGARSAQAQLQACQWDEQGAAWWPLKACQYWRACQPQRLPVPGETAPGSVQSPELLEQPSLPPVEVLGPLCHPCCKSHPACHQTVERVEMPCLPLHW